MARGNITKKIVDRATPSRDGPVLVWDQEVAGFGLKVTPAGSRKYVYQYRLGGREAKVRRVTIGAHGPWTPDSARKEAKRLSQMVSQGVDPAAAEQVRRRETVELALPAYAERFIEEYLRPEWKGGWHIAAGILRTHVVPALRRKSIREITRADVANVMSSLASKPATRRNAFAALRRLFKWAVNRGDLEHNPLRDVDPPPPPPSRDRVLSDEELISVWRGAEALGYPFGPFVQLLILTGQRLEEVAKLDWRELSRIEQLWTLPADRAKNGVVHHVPLSAAVLGVLDELAARHHGPSNASRWPQDGWLFSSREGKPVSGFSAAKVRLDKAMATAPANWRFHDLRRTLATNFQRLGVRFEVTEAVLNHVSGSRSGVAGVYQRYTWQDEKRVSLEAWGARMMELAGSARSSMNATCSNRASN